MTLEYGLDYTIYLTRDRLFAVATNATSTAVINASPDNARGG